MEDISKHGGDGTESSHHTAWNMPGQRPDAAPFHPPQPQVTPAQPAPAAPIAPAPSPAPEAKPAVAAPVSITVPVVPVLPAASHSAADNIQNSAVTAPAPAPVAAVARSEEGIERLIAGVRFRERCKTYNCVCHAVVPEEGQYVIVDTSEGPEYGQVARGPKTVTDHKHVNFYKINRIAKIRP